MGFLQADTRWATLILGDGSTTLGRGGCLLCVLCDAARRLRTWPDVLPPHANNALLKVPGAFIGSDLRIEVAAPVFRLAAPPEEKVTAPPGDASLAAAAKRIFDAGELAIFHVDLDRGDKPAHFVLGEDRLADGRIFCSDPAIGSVILNPVTLDGLQEGSLPGRQRGWPQGPRFYRVRSVRPLRAQPGAAVKDFAVRRGSNGDDVIELQLLLNLWLEREGRAPLKVDGDFGEQTELAVEAFQESQGLAVDGVVGARTSAALLRPR